jgi:hypothetical protein
MTNTSIRLSIVVEGDNDLHVVMAICARANVAIERDAFVRKSYPATLTEFSTRVRVGSAVDALGLIVDADKDVASRWRKVVSLFRGLGVESIPETPVEKGFIGIDRNGRRVGVWMTPDNTNPGVIESLFMTLIPPDDPDMPSSMQYVDGFVSQRSWAGFDRLKADVYSWLAVRPNPGRPMGENISRTEFPGELSEPARRLAAWVKALCEPVDAD